ncbi:hypothetical protein GCM10007874_02930 [Labrys miyagiensis]|uniref:Sel1 repeat family protein n=2 Tax=Labrys miyagiensis TaxID=346912 RepID=A0ABQ6CAF5_9HYPH|nr:hypothetical protein GCM10007874_02930 [Labrys miyagiensis]
MDANDLEQAEKSYQSALDKGVLNAMVGLADVAGKRKDFKLQFKLLDKYFKLGGFQSKTLATFYTGNYDFIPKDIEKYRYLLLAGAQRGDSDAAISLGNLYANNGDQQRANEYYQLSIRLQLDDVAAANLAMNYVNGDGVEQDLEKATYWSIFAAKLGNSSAVATLIALMSTGQAKFKVGFGPAAPSDATELANTLNDVDDVEIQLRVARSFEANGQIDEAISWYGKAAAKGNGDAEDALERLKVDKR